MSEHTQGRLVAKHEWLVPESHQDRPIGNSSNPIHDRDNYAHVVAQLRGRYHDQDANARRLAAAWNAFDGVRTEFIEAMAGTGAMQAASDSMSSLPAALSELNAANERIAKLETLVGERDAMLGKRPCQNSRCKELNAVRDLLREVIADTGIVSHIDACQRAQSYLDANTQTGEKE